MSDVLELNGLFEAATGTTHQEHVPPIIPSLPAIRAVSEELEHLLNVQFPALLRSAVVWEKLKANAHRVDGCIIGTGEADFTKGNTLYTLDYKGKTFQLIDVPGIEGDESKYASMVREAVAKAHLVFYVNGTNKKPEKGTAEKIRSYLRRGTQVYPLVNIRGNADAYEFEEDRASLESHGGPDAALKQTMGVLETELGQEALLPGHCIQGLLAFSSLAINSEGHTSIHPSRNHDLRIQQRNYLKHFVSAKAMFEFSQVKAVAQVLHAKLGTFREDIIESNKVKVRELLTENLDVLQTALKEHQTFMVRVEPEFEKCREAVNGAVQTFERLITTGRKNLWSEFFNDLTEEADKLIAEHFGDNDRITKEINRAVQSRQSTMGVRLQAQFKEHLETLQKSLSQAMGRLIQDVRRVDFQQRITFDNNGTKPMYSSTELDMELGLKDWGSIAFNVSSYALTGATIGTGFAPGIGTAIGAAVGAVIGALVSAMHIFTSREKRIRTAQAQVREKIDEARDQVMDRLSDEAKTLMTPVHKEVQDTTLSQIDAIHISLAHPLNVIEQQIALMIYLKNQLEKMPHGTIQAIRR